MKYEKIMKRMNECSDLFDATRDSIYLQEYDGIIHMYECKGWEIYEAIKDFAKENGFKGIVDIGCAFGPQSEVFIDSGINYKGINDYSIPFWNSDRYEYSVGQYPFNLPNIMEDILGVSVLCLTWNCYLYEKEKTLHEQCEALKRDFGSCLLYIADDKVDYVKKFFKSYSKVGSKLHYFSNRI